jgi:hypothetical protein
MSKADPVVQRWQKRAALLTVAVQEYSAHVRAVFGKEAE